LEQSIVINDNLKRFARDFYIKQKEWERKQDNGKTEREYVRAVEHRGEREIASAIK
jgi:hypothetical protein